MLFVTNFLLLIRFILSLIFVCSYIKVFSHSVQVQWCVSCTGDLRIWLEHWHGTEDPNSTTMTINVTINGNTSTITSSPGGGVIGLSPEQLPGCSTPLTFAASCPTEENVYNDWVYYDFPGLPPDVPLSFTIISGNTEFTQDCCNPCMYPLTVNFTLPDILIDDQNFCSGELTTEVNLDNNATWVNNNPNIGLPASGTGTIPAFTISGNPGTTATITYICGATEGSFNYTILSPPIITSTVSNYSGYNTKCNEGSDGFIDISVFGGNGSYNYLWNNGSTSEDLTLLSAGTYSVIVTDDNLCSSSEEFILTEPLPCRIENNLKAEFDISPDTNLYKKNDPIFFIDKSIDELTEITKWYWKFGDGFSSYDQDVQHSYNQAGDFNVVLVVENFCGCLDSISRQVIVRDFLLHIPNSFSPQGDEINDIFMPQGIGVKNYELKIYNRWGEHIFTSNDLSIGWDGSHKSKTRTVQAGVYAYLINIVDIFGKKYTYNGHVNLIR